MKMGKILWWILGIGVVWYFFGDTIKAKFGEMTAPKK